MERYGVSDIIDRFVAKSHGWRRLACGKRQECDIMTATRNCIQVLSACRVSGARRKKEAQTMKKIAFVASVTVSALGAALGDAVFVG